jgi:sugar phosphate isomerase/epimerase
MARPITLCTAQWADMSLEELAQKASKWGFDGLELACWGVHFDTQRALKDSAYIPWIQETLKKNNLQCWALATHLVGQAVCDNIDTRNKGILPPHVWGDGDPEGVRQRAAKEVADTARAAAKMGVHQINGFTGSSIWHMLYSFPPNDF